MCTFRPDTEPSAGHNCVCPRCRFDSARASTAANTLPMLVAGSHVGAFEMWEPAVGSMRAHYMWYLSSRL